MLKYRTTIDKATKKEQIETDLVGKFLLTTALLNKGTAFSLKERKDLGLLGKLPAIIETIEQQSVRVLRQYSNYTSDIQRNIFLGNLRDKNEILFYKVVSANLADMLKIIYTPVIADAVKHYSQEFRSPRGLYLTLDDIDNIEEILTNRTHEDIKIVVVTDGEGVLGLGDQGVGAMDIAIAKLSVYTICGGINPYNCLPVMLDLGTNNEELLQDSLYVGCRHKRIKGHEYDNFIARFVAATKKTLPKAFIHWEDLGRDNARRVLQDYKDKICTFNDDMQGTATVCMAAILAGVEKSGTKLIDQKIIVFGAGTAGVGIADTIVDSMVRLGLTSDEATSKIWLFDRPGLLTKETTDVQSYQIPYLRDPNEANYGSDLSLQATIGLIAPTILIGCSAVKGAFDKHIIATMAKHTKRPIIMPLSNPTQCAEAVPADIIAWSEGQALIATGSPFADVVWHDKKIRIAQCNNALSFPGIGLGVTACQAELVSDEMLWQACLALSRFTTDNDALLPGLEDARGLAKEIALAVIKTARKEGLARVQTSLNDVDLVDKYMWEPYYRPIVKSLL